MRRKKVENKEKIFKSNYKLNVQKELILREKVQLWEQNFDSEQEVKKIGGTEMKRAGSLRIEKCVEKEAQQITIPNNKNEQEKAKKTKFWVQKQQF